MRGGVPAQLQIELVLVLPGSGSIPPATGGLTQVVGRLQ
jgi:hypothetical protein